MSRRASSPHPPLHCLYCLGPESTKNPNYKYYIGSSTYSIKEFLFEIPYISGYRYLQGPKQDKSHPIPKENYVKNKKII